MPVYVPENPEYTIVDSILDSVRFTTAKTLAQCECGHLASISSFVDPEGTVRDWHDFGNLEGPGWAANAVGGAEEVYRLGGLVGNEAWRRLALGVLDHVLHHGFIDEETGFITGYRETTSGGFCLNYKHRSDWFCPGSMARIGTQLLSFADALDDDPRGTAMRRAAARCGRWLAEHVQPVPNGWFPRRCSPTGEVFRNSPDGGEDPFWQTSGDGLLILELQLALTARGLADYRAQAGEKLAAFMAAGGFFGSVNHDTYDPQENVAYAIAFRVFLAASRVLEAKRDTLRDFAYAHCLQPLDRFMLSEDRNGVATRGLLYMEDSWDTAYLWENAEAALAYFEAARDHRFRDSDRGPGFERLGLTILRAVAKHHYGPHGFLTEGVDWNNHVGREHHLDQAEYGAILYTEPFLNNQHIVTPTLAYLDELARCLREDGTQVWYDSEGNELLRLPLRPGAEAA